MTPHPFAVVKISNRQTGLVFRSVVDRRDYPVDIQLCDAVEYTGELGPDTEIFWADNEVSANNLISTLSHMYPKNDYALVQTKLVVHRPPGDVQRSVYTENGFLPE